MDLGRVRFLAIDAVVDSYWLIRQFKHRIEAERPGFKRNANLQRAGRAVSLIGAYLCARRVKEWAVKAVLVGTVAG